MQEVPGLDITSFLNLMVVLIPFLLISAVFSRVTILELSVPTSAAESSAVDAPQITIEVIVRENGFELGNGTTIQAAIPKKDGKYDLKGLSALLMNIKNSYPDREEATVLLEPDIEYNYLVQVMDIVRGAEIPGKGDDPPQKRILFPTISIGDAP
jgi:biopolymer transport protein ExbD